MMKKKKLKKRKKKMKKTIFHIKNFEASAETKINLYPLKFI